MPKTKSNEMDETEMEHAEEGGETPNAFEMLQSDHRRVQELFTRFEDADKRGRASIAEETLTELEIHAKVEGEPGGIGHGGVGRESHDAEGEIDAEIRGCKKIEHQTEESRVTIAACSRSN